MSAAARRAVHVLAFLVVTALVFAGGLVGLGHFVAGARFGLGLSLFGAGMWGWFVCCMAMAYWDARLHRRPRSTHPVGGHCAACGMPLRTVGEYAAHLDAMFDEARWGDLR